MAEGIISGIKPMEIHDGDGLRTTVFFKGCPLKCIWCHNPESMGFDPQTAWFSSKCIRCGLCRDRRTEAAAAACPADAMTHYGRCVSAEQLVKELLQDAPFFAYGGGVTLSGGECLAQPEFAAETARLLHKAGVSVYIDTCGYVKRETLEAVMPYTDRFLYDVKAVDPAVHKACTGADNGLILENLRFLSDSGCSIEIRIPLVVGCNDGEIDAMGRLLQDLPGVVKVKVLRYHALAASRYEALGMAHRLPEPRTTAEDVENAAARLREYGLTVVT